ncbi:BRCT domain-containing protein At4g02110 [Euphorbia lathyris]|uniref:BRCT domain-containing protein At4g02110 n=1 Tax=Euphorbia lathyris TaxID=212925 RepID=UPI0033134314
MLEPNSPSKPFLGVRFVLFGFDPGNESQVRAKLLNGGGVDTVQYSQNCTHVIVDKIVYDDPRCVNARKDGKTLVTVLWVDHSHDIGMAVDSTSIMYRPPRNSNGIPGANNLIVCLTGYQRQDRDDIMTMVSLMGAQFSKPLVANKVTHLICYKFEGEKYELANKLKKIKLVNHRWLEDCLRDWELLPEDNYSKSGYEMEMMEAEAKDSEEDAENITERQLSRKMVNKSPQLKIETPKHSPLPKSIGEGQNVLLNLSEPENLPSSVNGIKATGRKIGADPASDFRANNVSVELFCLDAGTSTAGTSFSIPNPQEGTPSPRRGDSVSVSVPSSAEKSHFDSRFSAVSYTRKSPQKFPLSFFSREPGNIDGSPKMQSGEPSSITSSAKGQNAKDIIGSGHAEYLRGNEVPHKEASSSKNQKLDVPSSNLEQQNISHDVRTTVTKSPSVRRKIQQSGSLSLVDGLSDINKYSTPEGDCGIVGASAAKRSQTDISIPTSSTFEERPSIQGPLFIEKLTPEALHDEVLNGKTPPTSSRRTRKSGFVGKPEGGVFDFEKSEHIVVEARTQLHQQEENQVPSPFNRNKEVEKSQTMANVEELQEGNGNSLTKPVRKKTISKRGSRPTLKKAAKQKGSIYSNKTLVQNDPQIHLSRETAANVKSNNANASETAVNVTEVVEVETKTIKSSKDKVESEANFMDAETEPPEDKDESVDVHNEDNSEVADLLHKADNMMDIDPEGAQHSTPNISAGTNDNSKEEESIQRQQKDETICKRNSRNMKVCKGKQKALGKTQTKTVPSVFEEAKSENDLHRQGTSDGKNSKGKAVKKLKAKPNSKAHVKSKSDSRKKLESFIEVEKENKPIVDGDESTGPPIEHAENGYTSNTAPMEIQKKSKKRNSSCLPLTEDKKLVKVEPVCFIVSGHRLQRKEFQHVIRRLKGKFCRDSHQWSYQATHFIAPDPIRRTEKFFAAAASGRWILKTDYLSTSSQAGRFLDEKPYEWHKNGLNEDGAINLEAPRKWRLLREKTGHGAFYGMRIIIYGECIAPPLDTLKRAVKAGDGTILATSPPYTRFLTSGVDFAVVSPGMPRVDLWVQEFLRHEIPCVVADYLVEYVCKPGYSLEKHVLYNTHAWAEKSVKNLSSKAKEIVETLPLDDHSDNDLACEVCGLCDRGDVMLICGDESGSAGCGKGMHIDCCDPPLQGIPVDDWFCPKCIGKSSSNSKTPLKKRRKGSSVKNK